MESEKFPISNQVMTTRKDNNFFVRNRRKKNAENTYIDKKNLKCAQKMHIKKETITNVKYDMH